ncbi:NAD(P)/FAD-dependent oxidoreductase [Demequina oxidasica]|uniref:NAD(P)/FAD-dependent oxidoreductase n=1 Tax=Demequina oxidasica TaxID=676199 RepID=UPI0007832964|nr:FAD-dependent oxidoreductase [Demequina oxidasica]
MTTLPVIVVGASLGGLRTAESLRRSGYDGPITVIGDESHLPYQRPPLSKAALHGADDALENLTFAHRPAISDVTWVTGTRVVSADLGANIVTDDRGEVRTFSALVVATGVRPRRLHVPGGATEGRYALRTIDDARSLRDVLTPGTRVVIAGAGFIGCEVAATAIGLGCDVHVVGTTAVPMEAALGHDLGAAMQVRHEDHGVAFSMGTRITAALGHPYLAHVDLADGRTLACDVLVEAVGSSPNVEWISSNDVDATRGLRTDSAMRVVRADGSPHDNVFAVGDVASYPHPHHGIESASVEHWNIPTETAKRAASVMAPMLAGDPSHLDVAATPFAPLPSFWTDQYDVHLLAYGMTRLADRSTLLAGDLAGECLVGYYRDHRLVGVCGIGMTGQMLTYRKELMAQPLAAGTAA